MKRLMVLVALLIVPACSRTPHQGEALIDWATPFGPGAGTQLQSISDANGQVSFTPIAAPSLGTPTQTWLITADTMDHQRLVLIYDDATYGRYIVDESLSETSQSELESSIQGPIQTLRDGTRAVLVMGDVSNGIMWLENKQTTLMDVYGPASTFSARFATFVADALETGS